MFNKNKETQSRLEALESRFLLQREAVDFLNENVPELRADVTRLQAIVRKNSIEIGHLTTNIDGLRSALRNALSLAEYQRTDPAVDE